MQEYGNTFARVYDLSWSRFAHSLAPRILEFHSRKAPSAEKSLLDLCCGTGQLANHFLRNGYSVVGVDKSKAMLEFAEANNIEYVREGSARFIHSDVSKYNPTEKFGLVVSTFDSINHLDSILHLERCFRRVTKALSPDGFFLFDLNTKKGLLNWNTINIREDEEMTIINRGMFNPDMNRAYTKISGFLRNANGTYDRFSEVFFNTAFDLAEVRDLLFKCGIKSVDFLKFSDFDIPVDDPETESRIAILAKLRR